MMCYGTILLYVIPHCTEGRLIVFTIIFALLMSIKLTIFLHRNDCMPSASRRTSTENSF